MKFIVDAQLPRRLSASLKWWGHDVLHTLDLPGYQLNTGQGTHYTLCR